MTHIIRLESVLVTSIDLSGQETPDMVGLRLEEDGSSRGRDFEVPTYNLLDEDIIALRDAALDDGKVRITIEVG